MFNIITIGDATVDNFLLIDHEEAKLQCGLDKDNCQICFNYADKIPIRQTTQSVGGNATNVAVGASRLGLKSAIVTELGDDVNGMLVEQELIKAKVGTQFIHCNKNKETRYSIVMVYNSERTILSYHVKYNYQLPHLPTTDWIYYSSLGANFPKLQDQLTKYLIKHPNTKLAINPGSAQIKTNLKKIKEIIPRADILFVNKEEAERIIGKQPSIASSLQKFYNLGVKLTLITDGTEGSYAFDGQQMLHLPIFPIKPIDKTGAGDAFAIGLLSALHYKKDLAEAMRWGTANAGGVVQKIGAEPGLQTKAGLQKILNKYNNIKAKNISKIK